MTWYTRDPRRLEKERELMASGSRADLHHVNGRLAWHGEVRSAASGRTFDLVIEYPNEFPHAPPRAFVVRPSVDGAPHRLIDGSLCLYANPWKAAGVKTTALAIRARAVVWFLAYEAWQLTGEWMAKELAH